MPQATEEQADEAIAWLTGRLQQRNIRPEALLSRHLWSRPLKSDGTKVSTFNDDVEVLPPNMWDRDVVVELRDLFKESKGKEVTVKAFRAAVDEAAACRRETLFADDRYIREGVYMDVVNGGMLLDGETRDAMYHGKRAQDHIDQQAMRKKIGSPEHQEPLGGTVGACAGSSKGQNSAEDDASSVRVSNSGDRDLADGGEYVSTGSCNGTEKGNAGQGGDGSVQKAEGGADRTAADDAAASGDADAHDAVYLSFSDPNGPENASAGQGSDNSEHGPQDSGSQAAVAISAVAGGDEPNNIKYASSGDSNLSASASVAPGSADGAHQALEGNSQTGAGAEYGLHRATANCANDMTSITFDRSVVVEGAALATRHQAYTEKHIRTLQVEGTGLSRRHVLLPKRVKAVYDGHIRDQLLRLTADIGKKREIDWPKRVFLYKRYAHVLQWCKVRDAKGGGPQYVMGVSPNMGSPSFKSMPWADGGTFGQQMALGSRRRH
ncbi:hypothetical protein LTR36_008122 [Oleoguttula mirabilis]|uniref:Uncharacterized protein n=1 Tax=Oleoguttula mirabilis TaxID=1507867 RepID=A0AAV9J8F7_9PEZI|nr:hypothetical protein LTR36_008122 [Oleoguttula mirabilis]